MKKLGIIFLCLILILLTATSCKNKYMPELAKESNEEPITTPSDATQQEGDAEEEDTHQGLTIADDEDEGYGEIIRPESGENISSEEDSSSESE